MYKVMYVNSFAHPSVLKETALIMSEAVSIPQGLDLCISCLLLPRGDKSGTLSEYF